MMTESSENHGTGPESAPGEKAGTGPAFANLPTRSALEALFGIARGGVRAENGAVVRPGSRRGTRMHVSRKAMDAVMGAGLARYDGADLRLTGYGAAWLDHFGYAFPDAARPVPSADGGQPDDAQ